jgi:hypothetical protein
MTNINTFTLNDQEYSVDELFKLKTKTKTYLVSDLFPKLKRKTWGDYEEKYSPLQVINKPLNYNYEWERIQNANLKYPILYWKEKKIIVDGLHRLAKAYLKDIKFIKVREVSNIEMEKVKI